MISAELRVSRNEYITPNYIRVYLTGKEVPLFADATIGVNNKVLIPPPGLNKVYFPQFDPESKKWLPLPDDVRPSVRTYTHRGIDLTKNELWIDFVAHGDDGPASAWAMGAKAGDVLGVLMKKGKRELYAQADHYVLVGDATAIPVLGAILEDLPASAKGICIIEVYSQEEEQDLQTKADMDFIWLHNENPEKGSRLAETLKRQELPETSRSGYVAAEFSTVKAIRHYLRKEKNWKLGELYAYSYWKIGVAEDQSAADRRQERAEAS